MCFSYPVVSAEHTALLDSCEYGHSPRYVWRRAALRRGWLLVRDHQQGTTGGIFISRERIVEGLPEEAVGETWEEGRAVMSVLGAISEGILVVGAIIERPPGGIAYNGLVSVAGHFRTEVQQMGLDE